MAKEIVFIHGLFQNPKSWTNWKEYFGAKKYHCHSPSYPFHEGEPAELRKKTDPRLGTLTFPQVVESISEFIDTLPEKPILIGHSMGGLVVQKLIALEKGVAGVCISSAPPKGIFSFQWSFLKANFPTINPFKGNSVCMPSLPWFHDAFCHTMTEEQTEIIYNEFVTPESRNIPRSSSGNDGKIDFKKPHSPLLFLAGEKDHIIPSSLNRKNFEAYEDSGGRKDFKEFPNRTHFICGQKNWEEIADFIDRWIKNLQI